jgi:C4-dicarboxylate transporter DctM subunit
MIVYGVTADVSIAQLFMAGVLPGMLLALLFSGYLGGLGAAPPAKQVPPPDRSMSLGEKLRESRHLIPVVLLIGAVLGSDLCRHRHRHRSRRGGRGGRAGHQRGAGLELSWQTFKDSAAGRHAAVLHDRADPVRRGLPDAEHGLHRPAAAPGGMDRHAGPPASSSCCSC